jgi:hypothetical protein
MVRREYSEKINHKGGAKKDKTLVERTCEIQSNLITLFYILDENENRIQQFVYSLYIFDFA